ncbi:hypothetical protein Bequi_13565 [Brachybacterium sp. JHP9]|uniref:Uncharacterized protein n=1 Tax=Brachybacterium equifaecis TaxID=2910770 RepID=A0ABT0R373_9MICO|nr:hypothetical protein [Brachybacterium equifaecis]MCL6424393.1 hypothetical protein [Brachybacterium equifaecis]
MTTSPTLKEVSALARSLTPDQLAAGHRAMEKNGIPMRSAERAAGLVGAPDFAVTSALTKDVPELPHSSRYFLATCATYARAASKEGLEDRHRTALKAPWEAIANG